MTSYHGLGKAIAAAIDSVVGSNEEILAPVFVDSYLAGGDQQDSLFRRDKAGVASFGEGGLSVILPSVMRSFEGAAGLILVVLASTQLNSLLTLLGTCTTLADWRRARQQQDAEVEKDGNDALIVNADTMKAFEGIQEAVERGLKDTQLSDEERMKVSLRVLRVLLERPEESRSFLADLGRND